MDELVDRSQFNNLLANSETATCKEDTTRSPTKIGDTDRDFFKPAANAVTFKPEDSRDSVSEVSPLPRL